MQKRGGVAETSGEEACTGVAILAKTVNVEGVPSHVPMVAEGPATWVTEA